MQSTVVWNVMGARAALFLQATGRRIARFARGRGGNVAVLTALATPVILTAALGGLNVATALTKRQELRDIAQTVCNRALKPTRMKLYEDAARKMQGEALFDSMAQKGKFTITSRNVSAGWLTAQVTASAKVTALSGPQVGVGGITVSVDEKCAGVPPYPAKGDKILTSRLIKPGNVPLRWGYWSTNNTWDVFTPQEVGWDGGLGSGVEIQDWCSGVYGALPPGSDSCYNVELDSWSNSSMYKRVELHRGTYRFSFWYLGRTSDAETNRITVYLEGVRPTSAKVQKLTVAEPLSKGWLYKSFDIAISNYSVYNLWVAAEGASDSYGGNFNDLELAYVKRPSDLYTD